MQDECNILIMIMTLLHVLSKEKKMYIVYKAPLTPGMKISTSSHSRFNFMKREENTFSKFISMDDLSLNSETLEQL